MRDSTLDDAFQQAVAAIDAGDGAGLERLLEEHPALACERLASPGKWLRDAVGAALDDFFQRPYLLWFVAEDPVRNGRLPPNIALLAQTIITQIERRCGGRLHEQLDYALRLVAWSWIARECGVQIALIDALVDSGAALDGTPGDALVNSNFAAAEHLIARGAPLTFATALCLERWADADRLTASATAHEKQLALTLVALKGKAEAVRRLLAQGGVDVNAVTPDLYGHATPLHHAVSSGSLAAVQALVAAGAKLDARDTAHNGTPLGWAEYSGNRTPYREIAAYLRAQGAS